MKLIIDIPEEDYERCKKRFQMRLFIMGDAIANGTPFETELEKIKAEIDEIVESEMKEDVLWSLGLRYSKKIIDKHIEELKGEQK